MSTAGVVLVVVAGVFGGALNTMAAGGGVFSFLALLLAGLPPQVAIATSQVAIPASFLAGARRAWRHRREYRPMRPALLAAAGGTALGVWLVSLLNAPTFRLVAPLLMLVAAGLLVIQPHMPKLIAEREATVTPGEAITPLATRHRTAAVAIALFGTAIYGGAFGGGVAVAILIVFATLTSWPWHQSNSIKNVVCLVMSFVCSAAFALTGLTAWGPAVLLAGSLLIGGALGNWLASRLSADTLRKTVAVVTVLGAIGVVST